MAQTITNPYQEYVPELNRVVWIKREVVFDRSTQVQGQVREMIWAYLYWSDDQNGPWTELAMVPYGFLVPSGG